MVHRSGSTLAPHHQHLCIFRPLDQTNLAKELVGHLVLEVFEHVSFTARTGVVEDGEVFVFDLLHLLATEPTPHFGLHDTSLVYEFGLRTHLAVVQLSESVGQADVDLFATVVTTVDEKDIALLGENAPLRKEWSFRAGATLEQDMLVDFFHHTS